MSSKEFSEWIAYEAISPGEPVRGDVRSALIAHVVANAAPRKKGRRPFDIKDFILNFTPKMQHPKTFKDLKLKMMAWKSMHEEKLEQEKQYGKKRWYSRNKAER